MKKKSQPTKRRRPNKKKRQPPDLGRYPLEPWWQWRRLSWASRSKLSQDDLATALLLQDSQSFKDWLASENELWRRSGHAGYECVLVVSACCETCQNTFLRFSDSKHNHCGQRCRNRAAYLRRGHKPITYKKKRCGYCRKWFQPIRSTARFCSDRCRVYASRVASAER